MARSVSRGQANVAVMSTIPLSLLVLLCAFSAYKITVLESLAAAPVETETLPSVDTSTPPSPPVETDESDRDATSYFAAVGVGGLTTFIFFVWYLTQVSEWRSVRSALQRGTLYA